MRSSMNDVAKKAKVSPITVSRVINSPEIVSIKTINKVTQAMKELNYVINPAAKALATNKTNVISVYVPVHIDFHNLYVMELITGISEVCSKNIYSFLITRDIKEDIMCDGYIITGVHEEEHSDFLQIVKSYEREAVFFGKTKQKGVDSIQVDNYAGAKEMVQYLIENGHRKIGMFNILEDRISDYAEDRYSGYIAALNENGVSRDDCVFYAENTIDASYEKAIAFLKTTDVTAFFCATDILAMGLLRACSDLKISIPEDLSIGGFDGFGYQNMTVPHITTMQQPIYKVGKLLAETLIDRIKGKIQKKQLLCEKALFLDGDSIKTII